MTNERKEELYWKMYDYINEELNSFDDEEGPVSPEDIFDAFGYVKDLTGNNFEKALKENIGMTDKEITYFTEEIFKEIACFMGEVNN